MNINEKQKGYAQNLGKERSMEKLKRGSGKKRKRKVKNYLRYRTWWITCRGHSLGCVAMSSRLDLGHKATPRLGSSSCLAPLLCRRLLCRCWLGRDRPRRRSCGSIALAHHAKVELIQRLDLPWHTSICYRRPSIAYAHDGMLRHRAKPELPTGGLDLDLGRKKRRKVK